jgi:Flp pilus assembly protein TadD
MYKAPTDLDAGIVAHTAGRSGEARRLYERALALEPGNCRTIFLLGRLNADDKQTGQAIALFERCIRLQPALSIAHNALGNAWMELGNAQLAAAAYRRATECPEPCVEAFCNLGSICRGQGKVDEAILLYRRALAIKPDFAQAWCNLGVAFKEQNRLDDAAGAFRQALTIKPDMADAHYNESHLLLLRGDFRGGWQKHEYRWTSVQRASRRQFAQPLWLGEAGLEGKTILIHAEQGFGDTLQFLRYIPLLEERGAKIILEVQPALKDLVSTNSTVPGLFARGEALPSFDFHCPLLSLPLAFSTGLDSIPNRNPYLFCPESHRPKWREILSTTARPRVGFVWFGNRQHKNDFNRSISPAAVAQFLADAPVALHCLQVGIRDPADAALAASPKMIGHTGQIRDFSDPAAYIDQLDLVISVDTSVAHLAGGLGKPLWVLLPFAPDWRWLLDRDDSPWYPTARLFRQPAPRDWDAVLRKVRIALENLCLKVP